MDALQRKGHLARFRGKWPRESVVSIWYDEQPDQKKNWQAGIGIKTPDFGKHPSKIRPSPI